MSSISNLYSTIALYPSYQTGQNSSVSTQTAKNLATLGDALQSGDLSGAQTALANLQDGLTGDANSSSSTDTDSDSDSGNTSTESDLTGPFTNNTQANADYQSMVLNLGSGDLASAAKDYTQLQTDLKLHSGGHHRANVSVQTVDTYSTSDSTSGNVFSVTA